MVQIGNYTTYANDMLLNYLMSQAKYIALSTTNPTIDGSGLSEPVGNNYSRQPTSTKDWNEANAGSVSNSVEFDFPTPSGSWGTIAYLVLMDAESEGNVLAYSQITDITGAIITPVIGPSNLLNIPVNCWTINQS